MSEHTPLGEERKVEFYNRTAVDGAPITYIIVFASIVVVPLKSIRSK